MSEYFFLFRFEKACLPHFTTVSADCHRRVTGHVRWLG
ncbi:hypothetical protein STSP_02060 [Streptomyces jeddahensis]|uniref:Uncharacterized protein n=1 Tax=Streptomyces jeddahensis TaxID=1716141 RepID=A0A177I1J1_9ACTN|nr:hypothetical protein STSP_02060 [Streptomyces jeddahensis]